MYFTVFANNSIIFRSLTIKRLTNISRKCFTTKEVIKDTAQSVPIARKSSTTPLFMEILHQRKQQSSRSILVQVQSSKSCDDLHSYCSSLGIVQNMFHYCTVADPMHFIIVEFDCANTVEHILCSSTHMQDNCVVPVNSSFMWFTSGNKRKPRSGSNQFEMSAEDGTKQLNEDNIKIELRHMENVSEQMYHLYNCTKLSETGIRLRFLMAQQIERSLTGMFPYAEALPFGSSVNGFGKLGCDLDIVLKLNNISQKNESSRLIFHGKALGSSERSTSQKHLEALGDIIQLFLPGCSQVRRILQARIPLIKYYQQFAEVECDLSMSNLSGVYMSDFLYIMGEFDDRVRPLVFTIRKWAQSVGLTNTSPGRWITNFSLTLLTLGFLQNPGNSLPVLPTLNSLVRLAGSDDKFVTEDGINCTFLRNVSQASLPARNTESIETLLRQFFVYYSDFDFSTKAVSLNDGKPVPKPDHGAMYIVNPLERGFNASKNVSAMEVDRFKLEVRTASWILESEESSSDCWGIMPLFVDKGRKSSTKKLINISTLFESESIDSYTSLGTDKQFNDKTKVCDKNKS